jgi:large subunit ribosomal protein L28
MARRCQVTGAVGRSGNNISHSHRRTKRRFEVNVQTKRYWVPSENRFVSLTVSAKGTDAAAAVNELEQLFVNKFNED